MSDLASLVEAAVRRAVAEPNAPTTTIAAAAAKYRRWIENRGRSQRHAADVFRQILAVCTAAKVESIAGLDEDAVLEGIAELRRQRKGREGNDRLTGATANHYRNALRGFSRWLAKTKQLSAHRLACMDEFRSGGKTRVRRELSIDDVEKVLAAAESGPRVEGIQGPDRAWLYRVALATGYRRGELSSLRPEDFHFHPAGSHVFVAAEFSKRKRDERQPIPQAVVDLGLEAWLRRKPPRALLWPMTAAVGGADRNAAEMIRRDLERAGLPYRTADGVADFHALRVAYCSWLARAGCSPKVLQQAARHSSIHLTMDVYTKLRAGEVADAVSRLPTPGGQT